MQGTHRQLTFFYPGKRFPAVSVTGANCALQCDYCQGRYLEGMIAVRSEEELLELAINLQRQEASGFLLSGGCDKRGRIPLAPYVGAVRRIKSEIRLKVNLHTGLLDEEEAVWLVSSGADCYSVDIVQDEQAIKEILHLNEGPEAYSRTLDALFKAGAKHVAPHLCLGLTGEETEAEARSIELLSRHPISSLALLAFRPTRRTPMANMPAPSREHILKLVDLAVKELQCPVLLGCMRARGDWELEKECIEQGVSGIAMPSRRTVEWAKKNGYLVQREERCCALYL